MTSPVDIRPDHLEIVQGILFRHLPAGVKVWVFGSRANWTTKDSSDLDLALESESKLSHKVLGALEDAFEDSALPYTVDVVDLHRIGDSFRQIVESQKMLLPVDGAGADNTPPEKWRTCTLGDLTDNFDAMRIPVKERDRRPGRYPYYGASGVVDYVDDFLFDGEYLLIAEDGENLRTRNTPIAFLVNGKFWVNNHAHIVQGNGNADTRFLKYALSALDISGYLTGSTMPKLTQGNMNSISILSPPFPEQRAIAHVLGTLDDKIELNRRMNETLEAMARALFKSWFVDFEPVCAKMEGRWRLGESLPGLPAEHYDLFPDRLVDSELGEVPEGWGVKRLGDVARQRRTSVKLEQIDPEKPYIALEHMPMRCIALSEWGKAEGLASGKHRFEKGDILFGKLRPYFHKVGIAPLAGVCSTDIVVMTPIIEDWFGFVMGHTSSEEFVEYTDSVSTGTKMPRTNWGDMASYPVVLPNIEVARVFSGLLEPLTEEILSRIHESRALAEQRDALLPRLVSGGDLVRLV